MFNVKIHCIIFGVNEKLNKRCILSVRPDDIELPYLTLDETNYSDLNENLVKFLKEYIFVNDLVLIPQFTTINSKILNTEPNTLDVVFAFIVDYTSNIDDNKVYWLNFDPLIEHKLSPIIFEAMQKLV
jgi:hypothetical protein